MKKLILISLLTVVYNIQLFSQGTSCSQPDPFCTGTTYTFPNNTGQSPASTTNPGNNYDCLSTSPNPAWYYLEVATAGNIDIGISQTTGTGTATAGIDVDFILYGPYDNLTQAISYCGNHGNASTAADGVRLYNYTNIISTGKIKAFKPSDSKLYKVIVESNAGDVMPPPPASRLTTLQINMIGKWITQGAKNNKCNENPGSCNTENVSFTMYIKPALASCTTCHKTGNTGGGINLDSYQGFKIAATSGRLLGAIKWSSGYMAMPQGSLKLPECTINKVKSWIDAGSPNN